MQSFRKRNRSSEAGFTLMELAIALAILGILVAIAVPTYLSVRNRAYDAEAKQVLSEIRTLAWVYYLEHGTWEDVDNVTVLGKDSEATKYWEYEVPVHRKDLIEVCAKPAADAPFEDRYWALTLDDDGTADLGGPDVSCP